MGDGGYFVVMHPDIVREMRHITARDLYKQQSHNERYKRRYGEYPKRHEAEIGQLQRFLHISKGK